MRACAQWDRDPSIALGAGACTALGFLLKILLSAASSLVLRRAAPATTRRAAQAFVLKWLKDGPWGEAAQHIIWQFLVFYAFLLVGFGFLYLMLRSTSK